jgi:hypothetical protein
VAYQFAVLPFLLGLLHPRRFANPAVVRFVWRHAAYPAGWSIRRQQLLLDDFALAAAKEVTGT